ncbi:DNA-binding transcriptional regulator LsrR (DeoR family) [Devosia subaequoris]|uniref:DNA-binding transcriptional regulator LsrR (DeoR family) n=1 Tax=Devosia subaequoris TaxID=395930 RepID=A0A7W6ILR2_9HYPH|nr:sugar-binding transcriptional regulator [Devosia subaequoris]MBB4051962.1 DNA-binding transcriptional regulator LsrR (DeoR family) [Devosia subaequoris]MCP1210127.1 sugar-binding transcriptional regulator [Devosia subaequoris]
MAARNETSATRLDDAARAGWLYYVAGNTQEEIASKMGISRQSAQRLVSLSVSEGLIKVRLDHPIGRCLDLAERLRARYALDHCEVVPSDPGSTSSTIGIAEAGAAELERCLRSPDPVIIAIGTGRTLKAAIEQLQPMDCPHHTVVSLTGNIAPDGSAAFYNVIFNVADTVKARSFPMPLPVIASSAKERAMLHTQPMIASTLDLAARANITFVGIGHLGSDAPLLLDGFISETEHKALQKAGAVGEICGWVFDAEGRLIEGQTNDRVASAPIPSRENGRVIALAMGPAKAAAIRAALARRLANGIITDEQTAELLLA